MFERLLQLLQATGIPFAAYGWEGEEPDVYGVVSLDGGGDTLFANNCMRQQALEGTVDLFLGGLDAAPSIRIGTDEAQTVQSVMDAMDGCTWRLNSVQYEHDTLRTHWEWVFNLEGF